MNVEKVEIVSHIETDRLIQFLYEIDSDFLPRLSDKVSIPDYARKLIKNANFFVASLDSAIIGVVAFYCNEINKKTAFISIIGVPLKYRAIGIGSRLIKVMIDQLKQMGFEKVDLETSGDSLALLFYQKYNFEIIDKDAYIRTIGFRIRMRLWLGNTDNYLEVKPSPLEHLTFTSSKTGINIFIKRDDLLLQGGGGNKSRKLLYILRKAEKEGYNAIVTTGSNQSNHIRATALMAAKLGWKTILVIHDNKPEQFSGNLKIAFAAGAEFKFVDKADLEAAMLAAINDLQRIGYKPLYIWGGGHCVEGSFAYYEAVKELKEQLGNIKPDFILLASGTGTTQAGLELGIRQYYPRCKVLGVSVSREVDKGKSAILISMNMLNEYLNHPIEMPDDIFFDDQWIGEGYGSTYPEVIGTINRIAKNEGAILDPIYTGKAFYAMQKYIDNGEIPAGSNVIFWHTGGVINFLASNKT